MNARLVAVQRTLWMLVVASLALFVLAFPRGRNRDYTAALQELTAFRSGFQQKALEKSLLDYAQAQGVVGLAEVGKRVAGPGVPEVRIKAGAPAIAPLANVQLSTLGSIQARSGAESSVTISVARAAELGDTIAWRLSRKPGTGSYELQLIDLAATDVSEQVVALDRDVGKARATALAAEAAFAQAEKQLDAAEQLYEARRKWKATWKAVLKADQARKEARATLATRKTELAQSQAHYEDEAKRAEAWSAGTGAAEGAGHGKPGYGVATIVLADSDGKRMTLQVPVQLDVRQAAVPVLQGTGFAATRAADLWDEVKDKTPAEAIEAVRRHFTWQYQYVNLGPVKLGGMTLLHGLPLVLPFLLALLLWRIRRVSVSYNPFGTGDHAKLAAVGLGPRAVDLCALAILPFVTAVLDVVALISVAEIPVLPVLSGIAALGLGAYVYVELGSLQSLTQAVTRSHSTPPPHTPP